MIFALSGSFDILIAARGQSGSAGYHFRGVIKRDGAITTFIGVPLKEVLGEDAFAGFWDVEVVADDVNEGLSVRARGGGGGGSERWVATVRTTEVIFP